MYNLKLDSGRGETGTLQQTMHILIIHIKIGLD